MSFLTIVLHTALVMAAVGMALVLTLGTIAIARELFTAHRKRRVKTSSVREPDARRSRSTASWFTASLFSVDLGMRAFRLSRLPGLLLRSAALGLLALGCTQLSLRALDQVGDRTRTSIDTVMERIRQAVAYLSDDAFRWIDVYLTPPAIPRYLGCLVGWMLWYSLFSKRAWLEKNYLRLPQVLVRTGVLLLVLFHAGFFAAGITAGMVESRNREITQPQSDLAAMTGGCVAVLLASGLWYRYGRRRWIKTQNPEATLRRAKATKERAQALKSLPSSARPVQKRSTLSALWRIVAPFAGAALGALITRDDPWVGVFFGFVIVLGLFYLPSNSHVPQTAFIRGRKSNDYSATA